MLIVEAILIGTAIVTAFVGGVHVEKYRCNQVNTDCWKGIYFQKNIVE